MLRQYSLLQSFHAPLIQGFGIKMKWRVGDKIRFNTPHHGFIIGRIVSRAPAGRFFDVMDDRGHMWRVGYDAS